MRKRVTRLIAMGLGAVAVAAATQAPAAAGPRGHATTVTAWKYHCEGYGTSHHAGQVVFRDYGEKLEVYDGCSDSRGIRVAWTYRDVDGDWSAWKIINYPGRVWGGERTDDDLDLDEGLKFCFQVGLVDYNGKYVSGSYGSPKCWTT